MRSSAYYVHDSYDAFSADFMHPPVQVAVFMTFLIIRIKLLLRILLFGSILIKQSEKGGS